MLAFHAPGKFEHRFELPKHYPPIRCTAMIAKSPVIAIVKRAGGQRRLRLCTSINTVFPSDYLYLNYTFISAQGSFVISISVIGIFITTIIATITPAIQWKG